jgi:hypothetical protein
MRLSNYFLQWSRRRALIYLTTDWMIGFRGGSSLAVGREFFSSSPRLEPTQPPLEWVPESFFHGGKAAKAWSWVLTYFKCWGQEWRGAIPPPPSVHLYGVVLSWAQWQICFNFTICYSPPDGGMVLCDGLQRARKQSINFWCTISECACRCSWEHIRKIKWKYLYVIIQND